VSNVAVTRSFTARPNSGSAELLARGTSTLVSDPDVFRSFTTQKGPPIADPSGPAVRADGVRPAHRSHVQGRPAFTVAKRTHQKDLIARV
jgi:hypothetical protein